jgi:hypothetical protein
MGSKNTMTEPKCKIPEEKGRRWLSNEQRDSPLCSRSYVHFCTHSLCMFLDQCCLVRASQVQPCILNDIASKFLFCKLLFVNKWEKITNWNFLQSPKDKLWTTMILTDISSYKARVARFLISCFFKDSASTVSRASLGKLKKAHLFQW